MDKPPFCSIVIPALNEEAFIGECLRSLNDQTYPRDRFEIIVVDNGSTDATHKIAEELADKVLLKPTGNVGAVRNFGVENARGDIIVCTDSDCLFSREWLLKGVELLSDNPDHVYGGGLKAHTDPTWVEKYWLLNDSGQNVKQQKALMGSCIFVWKSKMDQVGRFREDITSGEDSALSEALASRGQSVVIHPALSVTHLGNARTIGAFVKRQIRHAENYKKNIRESVKDPVFYIVSAYIILFLTTFMFLVFQPWLAVYPLMLALVLPAVFSAKRMLRAGRESIGVFKMVPVYALDLLYVNSRAFGLLKGFFSG